jgi:hypothetical protein
MYGCLIAHGWPVGVGSGFCSGLFADGGWPHIITWQARARIILSTVCVMMHLKNVAYGCSWLRCSVADAASTGAANVLGCQPWHFLNCPYVLVCMPYILTKSK